MITELKPLSLAESEEIIENAEDKEEKKELRIFIKKFNKMSAKDARGLREEIEKFDNLKIKPEHIVKITDIVPEDEADVSKIFVDVGLSKDEINKILELVKKYK